MSHSTVSQLVIYPDWLDIQESEIDDLDFCVTVNWRGHGLYTVNQGLMTTLRFLSRAGNWSLTIQPFQKKQFTFTFDEAVHWGHRVVNDLKVNGYTHAEWEARP